MPGGRGKARRACRMCKAYKRAGNTSERYKKREDVTRKLMKEEARLRLGIRTPVS